MATADQIYSDLYARLERYRDQKQASAMAAYMKTADPFFGVQSIQRRQLLSDVLRSHKILSDTDYVQTVILLWRSPVREVKYCAIDVALKYKKYLTSDKIGLFETMLESATNWDTVDIIAANGVGTLLKQDSSLESYLIKWSESSNFWMRRSAILAQLKLKEKTNIPLHFGFMEKMLDEKEFFIRKAIGWCLRELAKSNPAAVFEFILKNDDRISGLSKREALKHLSEDYEKWKGKAVI